ncbi:enoyl-CoA hydratase/isomerase family protein [Streptomyces spongiae]|nr:enoyl-CoA hydratase-related protein [Streptomyces spongiae]
MSVTVSFHDDGVAHVELCREKAGNAIDLATATGLLEAARTCESTDGVRAVLLTGRGRSFCVGGDLREFVRFSGDRLAAHLVEVTDALHGALRVFAGLDAPLVAAVQGAAAGAGLGLAAAADLTLAASDATFVAAYTGIGYSPDAGVSWSLPRLVGRKRALDLLLTNRRITAPEAAEMGLVSRVVEADRLADTAEETAVALARGATGAFGATRRLVAEGLSAGLDAHLDAEARHLTEAAVSAEGREGVAAFLAGRSPDFAGVGRTRPQSTARFVTEFK